MRRDSESKISKKSRSPLTAKPLRVPGQSLDEAIVRLRDSDVTDAAAIGALAIALALMEWLRWYFTLPPRPLAMTVFAAVALAYSGWRIARARRILWNLRQGRDGERAVAELLERLRERGFRVFHDVAAEGFNIDHILVGPQGLYAIETKTISKPRSGQANIQYDGQTVTLAGHIPERDPVRQASANARWTREIVKESTGRDYMVRPVVLYPGWFVEGDVNRNRAVWVLNPKALPAFISNEPVTLQSEDVKLVSYHLSRHVRVTAEP